MLLSGDPGSLSFDAFCPATIDEPENSSDVVARPVGWFHRENQVLEAASRALSSFRD